MCALTGIDLFLAPRVVVRGTAVFGTSAFASVLGMTHSCNALWVLYSLSQPSERRSHRLHFGLSDK